MNHDEQVMRDALAQHSGDAPDAPGLAGAARARGRPSGHAYDGCAGRLGQS